MNCIATILSTLLFLISCMKYNFELMTFWIFDFMADFVIKAGATFSRRSSSNCTYTKTKEISEFLCQKKEISDLKIKTALYVVLLLVLMDLDRYCYVKDIFSIEIDIKKKRFWRGRRKKQKWGKLDGITCSDS